MTMKKNDYDNVKDLEEGTPKSNEEVAEFHYDNIKDLEEATPKPNKEAADLSFRLSKLDENARSSDFIKVIKKKDGSINVKDLLEVANQNMDHIEVLEDNIENLQHNEQKHFYIQIISLGMFALLMFTILAIVIFNGKTRLEDLNSMMTEMNNIIDNQKIVTKQIASAYARDFGLPETRRNTEEMELPVVYQNFKDAAVKADAAAKADATAAAEVKGLILAIKGKIFATAADAAEEAVQRIGIWAAFDQYDADRSLSLAADEFNAAMEALGFETNIRLVKNMMDEVIKNRQAPREGVICYDEFYRLVEPRLSERKIQEGAVLPDVRSQQIWTAFDRSDADGSLSLAADEFKAALHALGFETNIHLVNNMMDEVRKNRQAPREGEICFEEFYGLVDSRLYERQDPGHMRENDEFEIEALPEFEEDEHDKDDEDDEDDEDDKYDEHDEDDEDDEERNE